MERSLHAREVAAEVNGESQGYQKTAPSLRPPPPPLMLRRDNNRSDMFDRRWIFLGMAVVVIAPLLAGWRFPESPSKATNRVFATIEQLPPNSKILMALDYDPGSKAELGPMAAGFTRHCAARGHKLYFLTLWPGGGPMIENQLGLLKDEFPGYQQGTDFVNFGYQTGMESVIKLITTDLRKQIPTDDRGVDLRQIPLTKEMQSIAAIDLIINVSAGNPGAKEWVLYAASTMNKPMLAGTTGVQAPQLRPYVPAQLTGLLAAVKGAAEYEQLLIEAFPNLKSKASAQVALGRMGPQLSAHLYLVALILAGNMIYFFTRNRPAATPAPPPLAKAAPVSQTPVHVAAAVFLFMGLMLLRSALWTGTGTVKVRPLETELGGRKYVTEVLVDSQTPASDTVRISVKKTIGVWIAALCTLAILTFLWGDNPLYKAAESVFIGASAGYWMVLSVWTEIVPKLFGGLFPQLARRTLLPSLEDKLLENGVLVDKEPDLLMLIPLGLSVLFLMRLAPRGKWLSNWSTAFVVGTTAGLKMTAYFEGDFLKQIQATMLPLLVRESTGIAWFQSLGNLIIVVGVLACLTYFFFSLEHRGIVGGAARVGVWFLMISFGASFALTVMGRVTLLIARLEFLLGDWAGMLRG